MSELTAERIQALRAPFPVNWLRWRPGRVSGGEAQALVYIDSRTVQARLDDVVPGAWGFGWETVHATDDRIAVKGALTICGCTREDVGEHERAYTDSGTELVDPYKSAVSDALKRCGVQFGVGRYLYDFPIQYVKYDERNRRLAEEPQVPEWAIPKQVAAQRQPESPPSKGAGGDPMVNTEPIPMGEADATDPSDAPFAPPAGHWAGTAAIKRWHASLRDLTEGYPQVDITTDSARHMLYEEVFGDGMDRAGKLPNNLSSCTRFVAAYLKETYGDE